MIAVGLTMAVLLVAGVVGAAVFVGRTAAPDAAAAMPAGSPGSPVLLMSANSLPLADASALEQAIPGLMQYVEDVRGLPFKHPVKVRMLSDAAFEAELSGDGSKTMSDEDKEDLQTFKDILQALGLIDPGVDLGAATKSLVGTAVAGFYNLESDDLVVRGDEVTPGVKSTLVHELTHALQDQHFDIRRSDLDDADDESRDGLRGLFEGDATRMTDLYEASLPAAEQETIKAEGAAEASGAAATMAGLPPVLLELLSFPYIVGPKFATALVEMGGQAALDGAFARPPTTSTQLLHPDRYLAGLPVTSVPTPAADGEKTDEGVLGQWGLALLLQDAGTDAYVAAEGWTGDRYVLWRSGEQACLRDTVSLSTTRDVLELGTVLTVLGQLRDGLSVEPYVKNSLQVTFTSCG